MSESSACCPNCGLPIEHSVPVEPTRASRTRYWTYLAKTLRPSDTSPVVRANMDRLEVVLHNVGSSTVYISNTIVEARANLGYPLVPGEKHHVIRDKTDIFMQATVETPVGVIEYYK